jgi:hypothetical protein
MAEPPAAAPAGVAVSGHDVLLATKLHLPRPRPGFVPRPRLEEDIFPDPLSQTMAESWRGGAAKAFERQNAALAQASAAAP